jgi:hypothetical protein
MGSGAEDCEMSIERPRSIVLKDEGAALDDGYKRERIAMRIEDSTKIVKDYELG